MTPGTGRRVVDVDGAAHREKRCSIPGRGACFARLTPVSLPMRRHAALSVAVFLVASFAGAQGAAPDPAKIQAASEAFDEGSKAFKAKDYDAAALAFEAADRAAPNPAALANAIRARKLAKQTARAATLAAAAVARYPKEKEITDLTDALLQNADKTLHRVTVSCKPECTLLLDNKVATPGSVPVFVAYLDPGPHTFVGGWSGERTKTAKITGTAGGIESVDLVAPELPPAAASATGTADKKPPPAPTTTATTDEPGPAKPVATAKLPEPSKGGLPPWVVFLGGGATVVLGGVATWSGIDTQQNPGPDAVRAACAGQSKDCPLFQKGLEKETRTNVLFGATAGAALVTGVVAVFFTNWSGNTSTAHAPPRRVTPTFGTGFGRTGVSQGNSARPDVSIGMEGVF